MDVDENTQNNDAKRKKKERKNKVKNIDSVGEDKQPNEKKRKKNVSDHADDRLKAQKLEIQNDDVAHDDNDDDNGDVTGDDRPAKEPKKPSKRQLKKEKADKRIAELREASKLDAAQKAITYVSKWKHAKNDWKFEKLRQIWLMDHLLDGDLVPDEIFPTALEYFEGCKGMARQQLVKKMMDVIRKVEEARSNEEEDQSEVTDSTEYLRARQVLQTLPTEA